MELGPDREDSPETSPNRGARLPVHAVILAGGEGRRLGVRKETVPVGDETFLDTHLRRWSRTCERVSVSVRDPAVAQIPDGVDLIVDPSEAVSVIDSIAEILAHTAPRPTWIIAVDLPLVTPELLQVFWGARRPGHSVFGRTARGIEMLSGLYDPSARDTITQLLDDGHRKLSRIAEGSASIILDEGALPPADPPTLSPFFNVNTPEELDEFRRAAGEGDLR